MYEQRFKCFSSLEKVMIDKLPGAEEFKKISVLKNERFSFQISYEFEPGIEERLYKVSFNVKSELMDAICVRRVGHVPSEMPLYPGKKDDSVISDKPGLYPDPLFPMKENVIYPHEGMHDSIWFTVEPNGKYDAGNYSIDVEFTYNKDTSEGGDSLTYSCSKHIDVEIIDAFLPKQKTVHYQWFHSDCLMSYYGFEAFSEKYWEVVKNFMKVAIKNGHNAILTPVFTPPLDTQIGGERPTVQLVDIYLKDGVYSFEHKNLDRFVDMCLDLGYEYFEIPPLFTQWGAKFTPKIMANVDGEYKRIFGWDVKSANPEYKKFLSIFLPFLADYFTKRGLKEKVIFHVSDEPREKNIEMYKEAYLNVKKYIDGFMCADALSDVRFYKDGVDDRVITPHYHSDSFFKEKVKNLWIYYCSGHKDYYSNRFFAYPLWRTRILGTQLFRKGVEGFVSWGYNFYYSEESVEKIDPYYITDGKRAFPSGDAFSVYPGPDGECYESIRIVSFYEALQDIRALELLSDLIGKDKVIELIDDLAGCEVEFNVYPANGYYIQLLRRKVNELIKENIKENK